MDLRTEKDIYRKAAMLLAKASQAPRVATSDGLSAEWLKERIAERTIHGAAVAETVRSLLDSADLLDTSATNREPAWVMVEIINRLTIETRRKPVRRRKGSGR